MEKIGRRFVGKVAIVTASTQGIGFGIAERLGLEGAAVVISSRRQVACFPNLLNFRSSSFIDQLFWLYDFVAEKCWWGSEKAQR